MRNLMLACVGLTLMSVVVSVSLWRELRDERALNAELMARPAGSEWRPASAAPAAKVASASQPPGFQAGPALSPEQRSTDAEQADREFSEKRLAELNDPEYRRSLVLRLARNNPGLVEKLNLSTAEATRLHEILADMEIGSRRAVLDYRDMPEQSAREAMENLVGELNRQRDEALFTLLGSARLAQYKEYKDERAGWMQLAEFNQTLVSLGAPLNADQSRLLAATLIAEQKGNQDLIRKSSASQADPLAMARLRELLVQRQAQSKDRILAAATNQLTSAQLDALRDTLQQQLEQARRSAAAMARSAEAAGRQ